MQYRYWGKAECGQEAGVAALHTAKEMFRAGGIRPFFVGASATMSRDLLFGGVFAFCRHMPSSSASSSWRVLPPDTDPKRRALVVDLCAGTLATVLSSPLNYVRNMHYATPPHVPPLSATALLAQLWTDAMAEKSALATFSHLQRKLRLGWGTLRVGCGMCFGGYLYSLCKQLTAAQATT